MSRSVETDNSAKLQNPAQLFIKWKSKEGVVEIRDRETKEKVTKDSISFVPLDIIKAVHEFRKVWSNYVTWKDPSYFEVKKKGDGVIATGKWSEIQETVSAKSDAKRVILIYCKLKGDDRVAELKLEGTSLYGDVDDSKLGGFYQFMFGNDQYEEGVEDWKEVGITIEGKSDKQLTNGANKWYVPVFGTYEVSEEEERIAEELDEKLVIPYVSYKSNSDLLEGVDEENKGREETETEQEEENVYETEAEPALPPEDDDLPF